MDVFVLIVSRLVPMLFIGSLTLVLGRVCYDILAMRSRRAAVAVFALIGALGILWLLPGIMRLRLTTSAARAYRRADWRTVDTALRELRERGGHEDPSMTRDWITAELNLGDNAKAEALILEQVRPSEGRSVAAEPQQILLLGVARYRGGRLQEAQRTLLAVPDARGTDLFVRDYYLGRLAEMRGDWGEAARRFEASIAAQPRFYPALHHLARCAMLMHDASLALRVIDRYAPRASALRAQVTSGTIPDNREFHVLFTQN